MKLNVEFNPDNVGSYLMLGRLYAASKDTVAADARPWDGPPWDWGSCSWRCNSSRWIAEHVEHGRADLNFSQWPMFDLVEQGMALEDIEEQIRKGEIPLNSYLILHPEARLSEQDRTALLDWARSRP